MAGKIPGQQGSGDLNTMTTEQMIAHYLAMNPKNSEDAYRAAMRDRHKVDQGKSGQNRNLNLRDAEHYLFAREGVDRAPIAGRVAMATTVPLYTAIKALTQNSLTGWDKTFPKSPPDFKEIYWGMRPAFEMENPPTFKQRPFDRRTP